MKKVKVSNNTEKVKKTLILVGEGVHVHVFNGDVTVDNSIPDYEVFKIKKDVKISHETPAGLRAEHYTMSIPPGTWIKGIQVEDQDGTGIKKITD